MARTWLVGTLVLVAPCGADEARQAVVAELAIGTWACSPDDPTAGVGGLTIWIADDGTFGVGPPDTDLTGTWAIVEGDLAWSFDRLRGVDDPFVIRDVDALGLDSTGFTLENAGSFEDHGDPEDAGADGEQEYDVEVHNKDSVTFSNPGGTSWTCERQ